MNSTVASHVRLDSLDGLRGIAVLLVVFGHGYHHRFEGSTEASFFINAVMDNSSFGVRLFFILSGFLITWLILREKTKTGSFHLTAFFRRRAFRILPAYLIYLLVMSSWATMGLAEIDLAQLLYTASFMWNYAYLFDQSGSLEGGWLLGHLWTLSVEMQFYLLWPILLIWLREERARWICLFLAILMPAVRVGSYLLFEDQRGILGMMFHTSLDPLMLGASVALWRKRLSPWVARIRFVPVVVVCLTFCLVVSPIIAEAISGYRVSIGFLLESMAGAILLWSALEKNGWSTVLSWSWLRWAGLVSYSWYLWQQVFFSPYLTPLAMSFYWAIICSLFFAVVSYFLIEKPFMVFGRKQA